MQDSAFKKVVIAFLLTTTLVFVPLFYGTDRLLAGAADEIVNQWFLSERVNIQQGNVLSSITKLQRSISSSVLLKGIIVKDKSNKELLRIGKNFTSLPSSISSQQHTPQNKRIGLANFIYFFTVSGLSIQILIGSYYPYYLATGLSIYLLSTIFVIAFFVRRETEIKEKARIANEIETLKFQKKIDDKLLELSLQVAHDIRSPLAVLNTISSSYEELISNTDLQELLENSIKRINEISEDLLLNSKTPPSKASLKSLLEQIVAEKNLLLQVQGFKALEIGSLNLQDCELEVEKKNLSRAISNIINNSMEAIDKINGEIKIETFYTDSSFILVIKDNGKGIPNSILKDLGEKKITFGKENFPNSGSGLGIYHAKSTMASLGGELQIESVENYGTTISLLFPKNKKLKLKKPQALILFEDDELVKISWEFKAKQKGLKLYCFSNYEDFIFKDSFKSIEKDTPIYCDVNLNGESGLEIVRKLHNNDFTNLHLCTGYLASNLDIPIYIKSVIDKQFPL